MALKKASLTTVVAALCRAADDNMLNTVLEGGSPDLALELRLLKETPSRIRQFTHEGACELIDLVSDIGFLMELHAEERRDGVQGRIYSRASELGADLDEYERGDRTRMQTLTAMRLSPQKAAEKLVSMGRIELSLLPEWIENLPAASAVGCLKTLSGSWAFSDKPEFALGIRKLIEKLDDHTSYLVSQWVLSSRSNLPASVFASVSEISVPVAHFASRLEDSSRVFSRFSSPTVSSEAVRVLREAGQWDILLYTSAIEDHEAIDAAHVICNATTPDYWAMTSLLLASRTPSQADAMIAIFDAAGMLDPMRVNAGAASRLTELLELPGLSRDSVRALLTLNVTEESMKYMLGRYETRYDDLVTELIPRMHLGQVLRAMRSVEPGYNRRVDEDAIPTEAYMPVAKALFQLSEFTHTFRQSSGWNRSTGLDAAILVLLREELKDDPSMWQVFFSLLQNAETGSIEELALAARAIG